MVYVANPLYDAVFKYLMEDERIAMQQSSGESGSGVSINLRGARSMLASNNPLILVDGVAYGA